MVSVFVLLADGTLVYPNELLEKDNIELVKVEFSGMDICSPDFERKKFKVANIKNWHPDASIVEDCLKKDTHIDLKTKNELFIQLHHYKKSLAHSAITTSNNSKTNKQKKHCHHRVPQRSFAH